MIQSVQHAAAGLTDAAIKDFLTMLAEHFLGRHAEQFFRGVADRDPRAIDIVGNSRATVRLVIIS